MDFMVESHATLAATGPIAVLFHPSAVPVVDVFRSLGRFENNYNLTLLDGPEEALSAFMPPGSAKEIICDAMLMGFALIRHRGGGFEHRPLRSRHGSLDEFCFLTLIGASPDRTSLLAAEAAAALGAETLDMFPSVAGEFTRQVERGSLVFDVPSLPEFRAMVGDPVMPEGLNLQDPGGSGFTFRM